MNPPGGFTGLTPGIKIGSHEIVSKLGAGGMGEVWRARDTRLGREVALKVISDEFLAAQPEGNKAAATARFQREARTLASLNHANIAHIYGIEESEGRTALVMELVPGDTLADRLARGPMPLTDIMELARQLAIALEYAHDKGVVHRDLKPANVKVTPDGQVKILDFGLAKALSRGPAAQPAAGSSHFETRAMGLTQEGFIFGTPAYMSPEQARGDSLDERSDIWAFGVVLYEMLTGRIPFGGSSPSDIMASVLRVDPDWGSLPAPTPPLIRRLLRHCLEKDPRRRLRNIGDAALEIEDALDAPAEVPVAAAPPLRKPWIWMAATGIFAIIALALVLLRPRANPTEAPLLRFIIASPEKTALEGQAVSPDGTMLAFTARDPSRRVQLYVRALNGQAAQPLPGTVGATLPFWSPDSRHIGFFSDRELKRIDPSGGSLETVCETGPNPRGGSWSRDGTILFARSGSGILRVPESGGAPQPLTELNSARGEHRQTFPHLLPDGRHFLYFDFSGQRDVQGLWVAPIDRPNAGHRLVDSQTTAMYAQNYLLYVRDDRLIAQQFDPAGARFTGDPVFLQDGVSFSTVTGQLDFSASDNGVLILGGSGVPSFQFAAFDRQGKIGKAFGPAASYGSYPNLSPVGESRIAASIEQSGGGFDLFILDPFHDANTRLTFGPRTSAAPVWSPDGTQLAFVSDRDGAFDIYQKASRGTGGESLLLKTPRNKTTTDWSSDGRFVLYQETDPRTKSDVWALSMPEHKRTPYLDSYADEMDAKFSPDSKWVAYSSDATSTYQVYVESFPKGTGKFQISNDGGDRPRWRRDGRELFYMTPDGRLMAVPMVPGAGLPDGPAVQLFDTQMGSSWPYLVSPDGKTFYMTVPATPATGDMATVVLNWISLVRKKGG
jgi:serine/threonine protein kinase/Tol biopolymer transport system component